MRSSLFGFHSISNFFDFFLDIFDNDRINIMNKFNKVIIIMVNIPINPFLPPMS